MTKREYKNQLKKYLKDQEMNLKDCLENSRYQLDYQLVYGIEQVFDLCLIEINTMDERYIEVQYYLDKLGFNIVLDTNFYLDGEEELFNSLYQLRKIANELADRIK